MPYCQECGSEVSSSDVRCSICGTKLDNPPKRSRNLDDFIRINKNPSERKYHNIEFALGLIGVVFSLICLSSLMGEYSNLYSYYGASTLVLFMSALAVLFGIIGSLTIRYFSKAGAVVLLVATFFLVFSGAGSIFLPAIFFVVAAILGFIRN